jgi:hypothetical protein
MFDRTELTNDRFGVWVFFFKGRNWFNNHSSQNKEYLYFIKRIGRNI